MNNNAKRYDRVRNNLFELDEQQQFKFFARGANAESSRILIARLNDLQESKDSAYYQRNVLVAVLARVYPSGRRKTTIEGWNPEWQWCVYLDLPTGQVSFHYHKSQAYLFEDLPRYEGRYDGHTKEQAMKRLEDMLSLLPQSVLAINDEDELAVDEVILERHGWIMECRLPLEISRAANRADRAEGLAAKMIIEQLRNTIPEAE